MQWGRRWLGIVWLAVCIVEISGVAAQDAPPPEQEQAAPEAAEAPPDEPERREPADDRITMDFQDVDLPVLVKFISEITNRNFILDERVKGKVTIISPSKITVDEAYAVFQSVLQVKGFTTVPSGSVIKIVQAQEAKSNTLDTVIGESARRADRVVPGGAQAATDEFITRLMPLKNVAADNILPIIQPLVSANGLLASYSATNTLIIIDSAANIARIGKIIGELDVEGSEQALEVFRLNYAFAGDVANIIAQVLEEGEAAAAVAAPQAAQQPRAAQRPRRGQQPAAAPGVAAGAAEGGTGERAFKIIPDERINALIVVAGSLQMRKIRDLVVRLDVPVPLGTGRIHVYHLKYANAFEVVPVLSDLIGGGGGGIGGLTSGLLTNRFSGSTAFRGGRLGQRGGFGDFGGGGLGGFGANTGLSTVGLGGLGAAGSLRGGLGSRGQRAGVGTLGLGGAAAGRGALGAGGAATAAGGGGEFEGDVRITADPSTNALIVNASPQDFETLKRVIELLDTRRRQVFVEAIILEVRLDKMRQLGIELQGATGLGNGVGLGRVTFGTGATEAVASGDPTGLSSLTGLLLAAASNQTIRLPNGAVIPAQIALLNASQSDNDVNLLSAPNILTTDNQEAEIVVGQNVPFVASRSTSEVNLNNQFATIERRDVGVTLRLTPQISEGGMVRLDIFQEVSKLIEQSVGGLDPNVVGPSTTIRSATTSVVTRDGQTVVIGGLIADDITNAAGSVPFISDIPVLGNLFKSSQARREKINLLIFLTPHIVRGPREHRDLSIKRREKIKDFMWEQDIPNKRRDYLDTPAWTPDLPPDVQEDEESGQPSTKPETNGNRPKVGAAPAPAPYEVDDLASPPANRYVLLASFAERGPVPDVLSTTNGLLAIELPADSSLTTLFQKGGRYRFVTDEFEGLYQCLEAFPSPQEALLVYPEGLPVDPVRGEYLHWRALRPAETSANVSAWTALN